MGQVDILGKTWRILENKNPVSRQTFFSCSASMIKMDAMIQDSKTLLLHKGNYHASLHSLSK